MWPAARSLTTVFFWFLGLSFAVVLMVFDSPMLDFRLVMLGAVLPWLDFVWGPPWPMHSIFFPVLVMAAVMTIASGKRLVQRRWLGLAIGLFVHLVLAATFTSGELFWWPVFGFDVAERPAVAPIGLAVVLEAVGLVALAWLAHRLGLRDDAIRRRFVTTGHIDRARLRA